MSFDKEAYWKKRKAGQRGQGEHPSARLVGEFTPSLRRYKRQTAKHVYHKLKKDYKARQKS